MVSWLPRCPALKCRYHAAMGRVLKGMTNLVLLCCCTRKDECSILCVSFTAVVVPGGLEHCSTVSVQSSSQPPCKCVRQPSRVPWVYPTVSI